MGWELWDGMLSPALGAIVAHRSKANPLEGKTKRIPKQMNRNAFKNGEES